jgi:hypothetical protein
MPEFENTLLVLWGSATDFIWDLRFLRLGSDEDAGVSRFKGKKRIDTQQ